MFKKGDKVICTGECYWSWAKGKTAIVNREIDEFGYIQVRFCHITDEEYRTEGHGHSGPADGFRKLTPLDKVLL